MNDPILIKGNWIDTPEKEEFRLRKDHILLIDQGKIAGIFPKVPDEWKHLPLRDYSDHIIIPSFMDLHIHAPQYIQRGLGMDMELIDWLNLYTFPAEEAFSDPALAETIYRHFAKDLYRQGTLRASVFSTVHLESTRVLARCLEREGLRASVGKVNMDRNSSPGLCEDTTQSLKDTQAFVEEFRDNPRIEAIITPRFAPSCSPELMKGLSEIAGKYSLPVQSHISENLQEIDWVQELFPHSKDYTDAYDRCGMLDAPRTLMAHGIYLKERECERLKERGTRLIHCPEANLNLASGIMPVTRLLDWGLEMGLGSDVGGGQSMAMNQVIVRAVQSSKILSRLQPGNRKLLLSEAFFLATAGNGKFYGNCGFFSEGLDFSALVIEDPLGEEQGLEPLERLQRYLYSGDDRNIVERF